MTREELKEHCQRQIQQFERVEKIMPVTPNDWKRYEEHKLILELLEQESKWIPVSEPPKESLNSVIGWDGFRQRCVFVQYIDGHFQITGTTESFDIKAWMPLPPSYKGE